MVGWEAQSWQVQETEDSEQTGSGDRRFRADRIRRQERAGENIQNAQSGQETGGSTVGLRDKGLTVSKIRDRRKR